MKLNKKIIRVMMLAVTIGFAVVLALTLVFVVVVSANEQGVGAETVLGMMFSFLCFAFFEFMAYAVVMLVLWAIRGVVAD